MNKRKKLIRTIAEKTGVTHAGAANLLDKGKPKFARKPFKVESLYANDHISEPPRSTTIEGGFVRKDDTFPLYAKDPDEYAFIIGEEGENILAILKPRNVIIPLVVYRAEFMNAEGKVLGINQPGIDAAIRDRMLALLDAAFVCRLDTLFEPPIIELPQVEDHFREVFAGSSAPLTILTVGINYNSAQVNGYFEPGVVFDPRGPKEFAHVVCVNGHAGIKVTEAGSRRIGLASFASRIGCVRIRRPV